MQLKADDLAESIREIDGSTDAVQIVDGKATEHKCPQCAVPMAACEVKIGKLEVSGGLLRCKTHSLWVPRKAMTAAFARALRRGGFSGRGATSGVQSRFTGGSSGGMDAASFIGNMPSGHSGMSGAMAGIAKAFGAGSPASAGLAISHWQNRGPRAHTLYISAHKGKELACPACKGPLSYAGDRWACATCPGLFVETEALVAMVCEMVNGSWDMPALSGKAGARPCAICETPMVVELLEGVTVDRCANAHAVWFDEHELEQVLHHAGQPKGLGAWIKRLFSREKSD